MVNENTPFDVLRGPCWFCCWPPRGVLLLPGGVVLLRGPRAIFTMATAHGNGTWAA